MSSRFGLVPHARVACCPLLRTLGLLLCLGLSELACGQALDVDSAGMHASGGSGIDPGGVAQAHFALLSTACTVTSTGLTIAVDSGETAIVGFDSTSGKVTVNANQASGLPCEVAPTVGITVTPGSVGDHGIYLDLSSGLFSKATAASAPKLKLTLGTGNNDTLTVRGSSGDDRFYFGKGTAAGTYLFNFNGGTGVGSGLDALVDVSINGADHVVVSAGAGDDIVDGTGLFGTALPYPTSLNLFGGPGDDTLVGGLGDDTLSGDAGNDHLNGGKGNNSYLSGSVNDGTDVVTVTPTAYDTVDYSQRFNPLTLSLDNSASSGEAGENDTIPDTVSVLIGGAGNDTLTAAGSAKRHVLKGGPGNDTLTGGNGSDTLDGGNGILEVDGDDLFIGAKATVSYSGRTQPLTVNVNGAGVGGPDANDGDRAATRHAQYQVHSTPGATITASTNTVTGLVEISAGSIGRLLVISGSSGAKDNGSYHIVSVTNATTVVLDSTDTAAKATWANDIGAGWSFSEDAAAEKDEVRCPNVIGSSTANNALTGDANNNQLIGGSGIDTLTGGAGNDTLQGLDNDDTLYGGAGEDTLVGGLGNDTLFGGDGNDVLEGDDDSDSFTCDGKNDVSATGSAPGQTDYTVDYNSGSPDNDSRPTSSDCEY